MWYVGEGGGAVDSGVDGGGGGGGSGGGGLGGGLGGSSGVVAGVVAGLVVVDGPLGQQAIKEPFPVGWQRPVVS